MSFLAGKVMKLSVELTTTDVAELVTFGVHTGYDSRTDAQVNLCLDALGTSFSAIAPLFAAHTQTALVASKWADGPGFIGWHQLIRRVTSVAAGSGTKLPAQIAGVTGYRTVSSLYASVPAGRLRNRAYMGPLAVSSIGADSRFTTTMKDSLRTFLTSLHTALVAVPGADAGFLGLTVVSPTGDQRYPADRVTVGGYPDTMRSRRERHLEAPTLTTIVPA